MKSIVFVSGKKTDRIILSNYILHSGKTPSRPLFAGCSTCETKKLI